LSPAAANRGSGARKFRNASASGTCFLLTQCNSRPQKRERVHF
jgi:hypothetical protein